MWHLLGNIFIFSAGYSVGIFFFFASYLKQREPWLTGWFWQPRQTRCLCMHGMSPCVCVGLRGGCESASNGASCVNHCELTRWSQTPGLFQGAPLTGARLQWEHTLWWDRYYGCLTRVFLFFFLFFFGVESGGYSTVLMYDSVPVSWHELYKLSLPLFGPS